MSSNPEVNKTFEAKVANLIAATRHLDVPQILLLRRMTMADPESRRWATMRQLQVVFSVIVAKAIERIGLDRLREARDKDFAPLLPPASGIAREDDLKVLTDVAAQMLGNPQSPMSEHEAALEKLLSIGPARAPARTVRQTSPIKEPPPLFAAQLGPDLERMVLPGNLRGGAEGLDEDKPFTDFPTLFDDTICSFSRKMLSLFQVRGSDRPDRLPFLMAPQFAACYEDVLRRMVLPPMRTSRHIQQLGLNYNWAEVGGAKLIDIIQSGEVNNPVLHHWDNRWTAFRGAKGKKPKPEDNPWPLFREDATKSDYLPPDEDDIDVLKDLLRYELESFAKAWREIGQLYEQEFTPNARQEQAREGAFRDGLMKWASKLPDHVGEFFAIKSYFMFPRIDGHFLRRLITNFGRSENERRRNAPYLSIFVQNLSG
ncbi:hypothetical protein [Magnetospirillum aberrantis]|uniref:Uncharacterized protein n=1 Tax=Magnetospirillum aberrantis SpK TaxID=908842 RepID=A0A7C9QTH9_9PROT|nr:hypothetical protein [Magnetospirillum aberrantis]NFV80164.1 hypothetical protein [Magnetospirillum aberrantis SpK]